jgi:hypothetical protein
MSDQRQLIAFSAVSQHFERASEQASNKTTTMARHIEQAVHFTFTGVSRGTHTLDSECICSIFNTDTHFSALNHCLEFWILDSLMDLIFRRRKLDTRKSDMVLHCRS